MFTRLKTLAGRNLAATVDDDVVRAGLPVEPVDETPVSTAELVGLPEAAQRYLRYMDVVGRPRAWSVRAHLTGRFRMRPGLPWMPCETWQYSTSPQVNRVFHMRIDLGHVVPVVGRDTYLEGRGCMHGKVLGLVTVAHGVGTEFDIGELTTYLNDAVFLAPSMLLTSAVSWSEVDADRFDLRLTDSGHTVTARVFLDERGAPRDFSSEDRYVALPGGPVKARWSTPMEEFSILNGRPQVLRGSAVWQLDDGPFEYVRLNLCDGVEYNVWPDPRRPVPRDSHRSVPLDLQGARGLSGGQMEASR